METENNEKVLSNCRVNQNKFSLMLWGKGLDLDVNVDDIQNPTCITDAKGKNSLKKANAFEIIVLKYLIPLILIFWLGSIDIHYTSMLALGIGAGLYLILRYVHKIAGLQSMIIVAASSVIPYTIFSIINFEMSATYSLGQLVNYVFQYLGIFWILEHIYKDVMDKEFLKYYRIEKYLFKYVRFVGEVESSKDDSVIGATKKKEKGFNLFLIFIMVFGLLNGTVSFVKKIELENEKNHIQSLKRDIRIKNKEPKKYFYPKKINKELQRLSRESGINSIISKWGFDDLGYYHNSSAAFGEVRGYKRIKIVKDVIFEQYTLLGKRIPFEDGKKYHKYSGKNIELGGILINENWYLLVNKYFIKVVNPKDL